MGALLATKSKSGAAAPAGTPAVAPVVPVANEWRVAPPRRGWRVDRNLLGVGLLAGAVLAWTLALGAYELVVDAGVWCVCSILPAVLQQPARARAGTAAMAAMAVVGVVSSAVASSFAAVSPEAQLRALAVIMAYPVITDLEPVQYAHGAGAAVAVCVGVQLAVRQRAAAAIDCALCAGAGALSGFFVVVLAGFASGAHRAIRGRAAAAAASAAAQVCKRARSLSLSPSFSLSLRLFFFSLSLPPFLSPIMSAHVQEACEEERLTERALLERCKCRMRALRSPCHETREPAVIPSVFLDDLRSNRRLMSVANDVTVRCACSHSGASCCSNPLSIVRFYLPRSWFRYSQGRGRSCTLSCPCCAARELIYHHSCNHITRYAAPSARREYRLGLLLVIAA